MCAVKLGKVLVGEKFEGVMGEVYSTSHPGEGIRTWGGGWGKGGHLQQGSGRKFGFTIEY